MNTSSNAVVMTNREFFQQREYAALCRIPGVREIIGSYSTSEILSAEILPYSLCWVSHSGQMQHSSLLLS